MFTDNGYSVEGNDNVGSNCFEAPIGSQPVLTFPALPDYMHVIDYGSGVSGSW